MVKYHCSDVRLQHANVPKTNLNDTRSTGELMLLCTVFQGTFMQEVYVHSFNQDERTQISEGQKRIQIS